VGKNMENKENVSGYFITDDIRKKLIENPDMCIVSENMQISLVVGKKRYDGEPLFSTYCRIIEGDTVSELVSGGMTFKDTLLGLGFSIRKAVVEEIQKGGENNGKRKWA